MMSYNIYYICIVLSQSKFVLLDSLIAVNLFKYKKILCFLYKSKNITTQA